MKPRRRYSTDLSDEEWEILQPLLPEAAPGGRPRVHQTRELAGRNLLRGEGRMRLALAPPRFPSLADCLPLL